MNKLTDAQRLKLIFAIDKAEGHGLCTYFEDGKPTCVTAQLAVIEGTDVKIIKRWTESICVVLTKSSTPQVLKEYPPALLQYLQFIWDDKTIPHTKAREMMRELVEAAASEDNKVDDLARKFGLSTIGSVSEQ